MYIGRLEKWNTNDWRLYYKKYSLYDLEKQDRVKQILTGNKEYIENNFELLKEVGIINGVGPGYIGSAFRWILTYLFKAVRYERHDVEYSIPGTEKDRENADKGLLKYSLKGELNILEKGIVYLCYYMVVYFGKTAFTYK